MNLKKKIAIIGAGGHGKVTGEIALLNHFENIDFFDDRLDLINDFPFKIVGTIDYLNEHLSDYENYFVSIGDNKIRSEKIKWLQNNKLNIVTLIHPKSTISNFCSVGVGSCVMANAVINSGSKINIGVIINTSASVDHDCLIEDFAHISPNCSLSGGVRVGKLSHLGSGTSVHPGVNIGNNVRTAVGSRIFKNILNDEIFKT